MNSSQVIDLVITREEVNKRGLFDLVADEIVVATESKQRSLPQAFSHVISEIDGIHKKLKKNDFYAFENAHALYEEQLANLYREQDRLKMAIKKYPKWFKSFNFLSWVQEETGYPLFMVLDPNDNRGMAISSNYILDYPVMPKIFTNQYKQTKIKLSRRSVKLDKHVTIKASFQGEMPPATRDKLKAADSSGLFVQKWIIAEAPFWVEEQIAIAKLDPLVVGMTEAGEFYLIDVFYPTLMETIVVGQYT